MRQFLRTLLATALALSFGAAGADAACCYFSAKNADILQPAQKMFITWDPSEKVETFTVQPKFEGNALDFGMVIPTPSQPKLNEMPRDFFKHLAIYTIMRKREFANSKLLPLLDPQEFFHNEGLRRPSGNARLSRDADKNMGGEPEARKPASIWRKDCSSPSSARPLRGTR
jgi:hypothetical protein